MSASSPLVFSPAIVIIEKIKEELFSFWKFRMMRKVDSEPVNSRRERMEKRYYQRMAAQNLMADVSDGWGCFSGTVEDLSRKGIQLKNIPKRLNDRVKQFSIIISDGMRFFKLQARPRWARKRSISQALGLEIIKAPLGWTEFVMNLEQPADKGWNEIIL